MKFIGSLSSQTLKYPMPSKIFCHRRVCFSLILPHFPTCFFFGFIYLLLIWKWFNGNEMLEEIVSKLWFKTWVMLTWLGISFKYPKLKYTSYYIYIYIYTHTHLSKSLFIYTLFRILFFTKLTIDIQLLLTFHLNRTFINMVCQ